MADCRPQPYRLDPPVTEETLPQIVTNADEMFQILFEDLNALCEEVDDLSVTSSSATTPTSVVIRLGLDGADGADGMSIPGPRGPAGASITGPPGPPGADGEDGASGLAGIPGAAGATGATGATGVSGISFPGADGEDGLSVFFPVATVATPIVQETTVTGTQNDFPLISGAAVLRCANATLVSFTGFTAGIHGQILRVISTGAGQVDTLSQNAGSVAANRFSNSAASGPTSAFPSKGAMVYTYDAVSARWRLITHQQGDWITVAYTAGDFTADAGTWTVAAGDLIGFKYFLNGSDMTVAIATESTTTSGVNLRLFVLIPAGFTHASTINSIAFVRSASATYMAGIAQVNASVSTTQISFLKMDITAWADGTNNNTAAVTIPFPVN